MLELILMSILIMNYDKQIKMLQKRDILNRSVGEKPQRRHEDKFW